MPPGCLDKLFSESNQTLVLIQNFNKKRDTKKLSEKLLNITKLKVGLVFKLKEVFS